MTYLASAGAAVGTWIGRANQAWGPSRIWNNGISWETDRNNWYNQAQTWYTSRYNEGYAAGDAAGYTRGYNAGAASKTTSSVGTSTSGTGGLPQWPSTSGDLGSVTCPRTGLAHVSYRTGSNGDDAAVHVFRNGVLAIQGQSANGGLNTTFAVQGNLNVNQGDTISVRASGSDVSGLQGGYLLVTVGSV